MSAFPRRSDLRREPLERGGRHCHGGGDGAFCFRFLSFSFSCCINSALSVCVNPFWVELKREKLAK